MHQASLSAASSANIFIGAAAVADFKPAHQQTQKIKKGSGNTLVLELVKNPDIIADVAALSPKPLMVGFAAETHNVEQYATGKLQAKKLDAVVANDVSAQGIGFNSDQNAVTFIHASGSIVIPQSSKHDIARSIIHQICQLPASQ